MSVTLEHVDYRDWTYFSHIVSPNLPWMDGWTSGWADRPHISPEHGNFLCLFSNLSLQLEMALSVDSSWHRWQWRVRDGLPQSPSEATPLLSPEKGRQTYNLTQQRVVFPNNSIFHQDWENVSRRYSSNRICTTKYTLFTFLPQNLFEQFHRYTTTWPNDTHFNQASATGTNSETQPSGHLSFNMQMCVPWEALSFIHPFVHSINIYQNLLCVKLWIGC